MESHRWRHRPIKCWLLVCAAALVLACSASGVVAEKTTEDVDVLVETEHTEDSPVDGLVETEHTEDSPVNGLVKTEHTEDTPVDGLMETEHTEDFPVDGLVETEHTEDTPVDVTKVFLPTHEWQIIKPDETLFAGLHYRINLTTKKKEAKLLDGNDGTEYYDLLRRWLEDAAAGNPRIKNGGFKVTKKVKPPRSNSDGLAAAVVTTSTPADAKTDVALVLDTDAPVAEDKHKTQDATFQQQDASSTKKNSHLSKKSNAAAGTLLNEVDPLKQEASETLEVVKAWLSETEETFNAGKDGGAVHNHFTREELEHSLKNIMSDDTRDSNDLATTAPAEAPRKFRSYEELKAELELLSLIIGDEQSDVQQIVSDYHALQLKGEEQGKEEEVVEEKESLLDALEVLLHDIDNARVFIDRGGVLLVAVPALRSAGEGVRVLGCRAVQVCVQNFPHGQAAALKGGLVPVLLDAAANDQEALVRVAAVRALAAVTSNFPAGQSALLRAEEQQRAPLRAMLAQPGISPLKTRVLQLLGDLVVQHRDATELSEFKRQQLHAVGLEDALLNMGWCGSLTDTLTDLYSQYMRSDIMEQDPGVGAELDVVVGVMTGSSEVCKAQWRGASTAELLRMFSHKLRLLTSQHPDRMDQYLLQLDDMTLLAQQI